MKLNKTEKVAFAIRSLATQQVAYSKLREMGLANTILHTMHALAALIDQEESFVSEELKRAREIQKAIYGD